MTPMQPTNQHISNASSSSSAWEAGEQPSGQTGCLDAWMLGCVDVWMLGCLDAWVFGCLEDNTADSDADRKGTVTTLGWEAEPSGGLNQPNKKYHSFSEHFKITSNHKGWNLVKKHSQLLDIVGLDNVNRECIRTLPYLIHQGILSPGSVPGNTISRQ